jgi:hypothetical protein
LRMGRMKCTWARWRKPSGGRSRTRRLVVRSVCCERKKSSVFFFPVGLSTIHLSKHPPKPHSNGSCGPTTHPGASSSPAPQQSQNRSRPARPTLSISQGDPSPSRKKPIALLTSPPVNRAGWCRHEVGVLRVGSNGRLQWRHVRSVVDAGGWADARAEATCRRLAKGRDGRRVAAAHIWLQRKGKTRRKVGGRSSTHEEKKKSTSSLSLNTTTTFSDHQFLGRISRTMSPRARHAASVSSDWVR